MMNVTLISHLYDQYKYIITGVTIALLDVALMQRFYGYDDFAENIIKIIIPTLEIIIIGPYFIYISLSL